MNGVLLALRHLYSSEAQNFAGLSGLLPMIKIISRSLHLGSILMIKNQASGTQVHDQKQTNGGECVVSSLLSGFGMLLVKSNDHLHMHGCIVVKPPRQSQEAGSISSACRVAIILSHYIRISIVIT